jgi:hypothetical protein
MMVARWPNAVGIRPLLGHPRRRSGPIPYAFTGTVKKVVFDLKPSSHDDEQALHDAGAHVAAAHGISA